MDNLAFTGFYAERLRVAIAYIPDEPLRLFLALATYANKQGTCYPGIRELSQRTALNVHHLMSARAWLVETGFIAIVREGERDKITGQKLPDVYALNPALLVASEPLEGVIFAILPSSPVSNLPSKRNRTKVLKDQPESVKQNQVTTTTKQTPHKSGEEFSLNGASGKPKRGEKPVSNHGEKRNKPEQAQAEQTARSAESTEVPGAPVDFDLPLADVDAEAVANEVYRELGNVSHARSRSWVVEYGGDRLRAAIRLFHKQPREKIANPGGYVLALLQKKLINADDLKSVWEEWVNV